MKSTSRVVHACQVLVCYLLQCAMVARAIAHIFWVIRVLK